MILLLILLVSSKKREDKGLLKFDYICGVPMGSLPYVASLATVLGKKQLYAGKLRKHMV